MFRPTKQIQKKPKKEKLIKDDELLYLDKLEEFPLVIQVTLKCGIIFEIALAYNFEIVTVKLVSKGPSELWNVDMVFGNIFGQEEAHLKPLQTKNGEFILIRPESNMRAYACFQIMAGLSKDTVESSNQFSEERIQV